MFGSYVFACWDEPSQQVSEELRKMICERSGELRSHFLSEDASKIKVILCASIAHLRDTVVTAERLRAMGTLLFDHCVMSSFVTDSVRQNYLQDIKAYTLQSVMSQCTKTFRLGEAVTPDEHFYVSRNIDLPGISTDRGSGRCFLNLFNHSQAGKSTALAAALDQMRANPKFHIALCRCSGLNIFQDLFEAFELEKLGYGGLNDYVVDSNKQATSIGAIFRTNVLSAKPIVLICDNLDSLVRDTSSCVFFNFLKVVRENEAGFPNFKAFIGVGEYRSRLIPSRTGSAFKFRPSEVIRFESYFELKDVESLASSLRRETGINVDREICDEIFACTSGHPGFVSFYFYCILEYLKNKTEQLDRAIWGRISTGKQFSELLGQFDLGIKINSVCQLVHDGDESVESILTKMLISSEAGYAFNHYEKDDVNRLVDFGIVRIDSNKIYFNCDVVSSQVMDLLLWKGGTRTCPCPQFSGEELEAMSMFDFLKNTLPFMDTSELKVEFSSKTWNGNKVPSEYAYQFSLNRLFNTAGNGYYRVFNESNHWLGARLADIRIVNGLNWALLELMSHADEKQFIEHIRRTHHTYAITHPKHLAVIQFQTDPTYVLTEGILAEIEDKKETVEVFVVTHTGDYNQVSIHHVSRKPKVQIDVRSVVFVEASKKKRTRVDSAASGARSGREAGEGEEVVMQLTEAVDTVQAVAGSEVMNQSMKSLLRPKLAKAFELINKHFESIPEKSS